MIVPVCGGGGGGKEVGEGFTEVEERLEGERLGEALHLMLAIGKGIGECDEVEVIFSIFAFIFL